MSTAPTLTGQGDRRAGLTPDVGVDTHVADLEELLWFEDLSEVHLVLHSYAGVLAGPLAERAEERLASVVYLGAFVTAPGQSLLDVEPPEVAERYRRQVAEAGDGWFLPASDAFLEQWGIEDAAERALGRRPADRLSVPLPDRTHRVRPRPAGPAAQGLRGPHRSPAAQPRTVRRGGTRGGVGDPRAPCGHDMMLAAPEETADLLEAIALGLSRR